MTQPAERPTTYACLVGHRIPADELETLSEVRVLDHGAQVRLCREHGSPIVSSSTPEPGSRSEPGQA